LCYIHCYFYYFYLFFFYYSGDHLYLHSFPTRRSSDLERMRFDRMGVFTYSHEDDTHSFSMPDDIPAEVKQERADELMELQQGIRSEEHTSELQSQSNLVCRLLLEKKKKKRKKDISL